MHREWVQKTIWVAPSTANESAVKKSFETSRQVCRLVLRGLLCSSKQGYRISAEISYVRRFESVVSMPKLDLHSVKIQAN